MGYESLIEIRQTRQYADWFNRLRDRRARSLISVRLRRLQCGNPGDVSFVGEGVSELRIHHGPGYRVYYTQRGCEVVVLLAGGDKSSQRSDISLARQLARQIQGAVNMAKTKGKVATTRWEVVDYLKTNADRAGYLEAALEQDDPSFITVALGDIARSYGMAEIARQTGLGRESLYKALSADGNPELATVIKVLRALGLRLHAAPA